MLHACDDQGSQNDIGDTRQAQMLSMLSCVILQMCHNEHDRSLEL